MRYLITLLALGIALTGLTGCNSFKRRAEKKADVFNALSPETQARLERKVINVGDSADMVYIALGEPDQKRTTVTATGETGRWIYSRYWQEYQGEAYGGFRREVVRDPKTGSYNVFLVPVSRPVYANHTQETVRIVFENGKVSQVEQAKD